MVGYAYPTTAHNNRAVTPREYEQLMHRMGPDGLIGDTSMPDLVYADSTLLGVKIRANRSAIIRGLRWDSDTSDTSVPVAANTTAGTSRIDLIVLRMTRNPWDADIAVVQGTAVANPSPPSPTLGENTSTGVWELPLAEVTVPYNATTTGAGQCVSRAWYVGPDGQYLCTTTTRPPHSPNRTILETDTGLVRVSIAGQWVTVTSNGADTVVNTSLSGWAVDTDSALVLRGRVVDLRAGTWRRTGGTIAAGTDIRLPMTVPAAFRHPNRDRRMLVWLTGGRAGHATLYRADRADRAGQLWLTEHPGISTSQVVAGADMTWTL